MKRVGEHDVEHEATGIVVAEIDCRVRLEIPGDVAGETDGG